EILADVKDLEEARVLTDMFQTVEIELPESEAMRFVTKYAERFTVDKIQISYRSSSGDSVPEMSQRAAEVSQEFDDSEVPEGKAQVLFRFISRDHHYAIVDEVDSLLIDEARTPLIISGQVDRSTHRYDQMKPLVESLARRQKDLVKDLLDDADALLKEGDDDSRYRAGIRLLQAKKAMPKNKRFMKFKSDPAIDRLITKCENDFMIDQKSKVGEKSMGYVEEELFFVIDEKGHSVELTEKGRESVSPDNPDRFLLTDLVESFSEIEGDEGLSAEEREQKKAQLRQENEIKTEELHNISQLLRAFTLFEREVEYIVQDNKVIIVDEFTGRPQPGRRYSDGLHQAIEAKENVKIEKESQTLATITIQNYFRMYDKLAGMTGTAETEAAEFGHTYKMDVVVIPTNRPVTRIDYDDVIYRTRREKYNAITDETIRLNQQGLPVLIGTVSVEVSELLSRMLKRRGLSHSVLNAKHLQKEAEIVRNAGQMGAVTIATNMAGRGTDIKLGPGVLDPPDDIEVDPEQPRGLQIIGSERHDSRRIDRQLRGRAGRQGDPGSSQFFLSLEDDLMRLFGSDRISGILQRLGLEEGEEIQHGFVTKAITRAQKKIESINFEQRKRTLDYDNVMNKQRESIYGLRRETLVADDLRTLLLDIVHDALASQAASYVNENAQEQNAPHYDLEKFQAYVQMMVPGADVLDIEPAGEPTEEYLDQIMERIEQAYEDRRELLGPQLTQELARFVVLQAIDNQWRDHLAGIDELREGIHLRSYAQLDPLIEYQREATYMFQEMMGDIQRLVLEHFFRMNVVAERQQASSVETGRGDLAAVGAESQQPETAEDGAMAAGRPNSGQPRKPRTFVREEPKVGRNDPCPCGSGKKYKKCCGR
ncbi:MAG: SEC-C metal-binding domain-containing protein, partial [Candidatus Sumerlaeota bacterium]